jgi:hypothetical protein
VGETIVLTVNNVIMKTKIKFIYSAFVLIALMSFSSCTEDSAGISKVTTFPVITVLGAPSIGVAKGIPYVDPGFKAMEGTKDITSNVVVKGTVDVNKSGAYFLVYEATNSDGFKRSESRTVIVYDKSSISTADISGVYKSTIKRKVLTTGVLASRGPYSIVITKLADGLFIIDDLLGGWYYYGSAYGVGYAGLGYVVLKADNTLSIAYSTIPSWSDSVKFFAASTYNPATGTILLNSMMNASTNYEFAVTLTK